MNGFQMMNLEKDIALDSWVHISMIKKRLYKNKCQHDEQTLRLCIDAKVPNGKNMKNTFCLFCLYCYLKMK